MTWEKPDVLKDNWRSTAVWLCHSNEELDRVMYWCMFFLIVWGNQSRAMQAAANETNLSGWTPFVLCFYCIFVWGGVSGGTNLKEKEVRWHQSTVTRVCLCLDHFRHKYKHYTFAEHTESSIVLLLVHRGQFRRWPNIKYHFSNSSAALEPKQSPIG